MLAYSGDGKDGDDGNGHDDGGNDKRLLRNPFFFLIEPSQQSYERVFPSFYK